jgi:hypothetical protein
MTIREKETQKRFQDYFECAVLLKNFYDKGFKSYQALKAIVGHYDSTVDDFKLKQIWNLKSVDGATKIKLDAIFEKLKCE